MSVVNNPERKRFSLFRDGVTVSVPSRAAVSVFDMNAFARGRAGGGNSGVGLSIYTKVAVRRCVDPRPRQAEWRDQYLLFDHCVAVWGRVVGDPGPFELEILASPPAHVGLSSSSALQTAVFAGLNWLDGLPLADNELLQLVHSSYKEVEAGALVDGFATGLASLIGLYGGFAAIDTDLQPLRRLALPNWAFEVLLPDERSKRNFGDHEAQLLMGEGRRRDARDRNEKRRLIEELLFPAAQARNLREFGRAVCEIQSIGNKQAQISAQGEHMHALLHKLRTAGFDCVFMSSLGPGIIVLTEEPSQELASTCDELSLQRMYSGRIDSRGIVLEPT